MDDPSISALLTRTSSGAALRGAGCPADDRLVDYVQSRLAGEEREWFEHHLADCGFCRGQVGFLARAAELGPPPAVPLHLLAAARGVRARPFGRLRFASLALVGAAGLLAILVLLPPRGRDAVVGGSTSPAVEPYPYQPVVLRGVPEPADSSFEAAMAPYLAGDWRAASAALSSVAEEQPDRAQVHFYLGVSLLLAARPDEATRALERAAQLDEGYRDDALRYLALARDRGARRPGPQDLEGDGTD